MNQNKYTWNTEIITLSFIKCVYIERLTQRKKEIVLFFSIAVNKCYLNAIKLECTQYASADPHFVCIVVVCGVLFAFPSFIHFFSLLLHLTVARTERNGKYKLNMLCHYKHWNCNPIKRGKVASPE